MGSSCSCSARANDVVPVLGASVAPSGATKDAAAGTSRLKQLKLAAAQRTARRAYYPAQIDTVTAYRARQE
eukprot:scaffold241835_cov52-Prasinocladus_malaysianus.AAC.1